MGKLEVIDGKATNWAGLWWQAESNYFASQAISLTQLRKFKGNVRLIVRKNKFFNNGENGRPNYVFLLKDAKGERPFALEVGEDKENIQSKIDKLTKILKQAHDGSEYRMLPSESQARADYLESEAIKLIEEITGEEWYFAYTYFG